MRCCKGKEFSRKKRKYHTIREIVGRGDNALQKVALANYVADPLPKAMTRQQLDMLPEKGLNTARDGSSASGRLLDLVCPRAYPYE